MNKDQGGEAIVVQGITCHLPPMPPKHTIQNYGLPQKGQKWKRTELPVFRARDIDIWDQSEYKQDDIVTWDEAVRQEHIKIYGTDPYDVDQKGNEKKVPGVETDPDYCMECLEAFRRQELSRVQNGHWIYIKGRPLYLTGNYYFYLNYWALKDGPAEFRYTDLELFWFWESVKLSDNFLGIIYITMRGVGKSYIMGCIKYYAAITKRKAYTNVQSKSDTDAENFFREKVMVPVSGLPEFLVPTNKHTGDLSSNKEFIMSPPPRKGMNARLYFRLKKEALYSTMQYTNAGELAADGGTWDILVQDEVGKTDPKKIADVHKRLMNNINTVWRGNKKLGNILASTTVEDMKEGGAECKKIFDESNQYKLNVAGTTNTQLARFFRCDIDTTYFDEFGFPDHERARKWHDAKRESLKHDTKAWISYVQKHPRTVEEAFWTGADKCIYNAEILLDAKRRVLESDTTLVQRGDIIWKEKDKEAVFVPNKENGKWEVSFMKFTFNMVQVNEGHQKTFTPKANHKRIMAIDPFSVRDLADPERGSNGAASVYNRPDINIPEEYSDTIIADYQARPNDPFDFYEDMICAAFFFGCAMFIETNKSNMIDYLRHRGYKWGYDANPNDFVWERPVSTFTKDNMKATDGMASGTGTIEHYTTSTANHIINHGHKLKHIRVINDWLSFDPGNTRKFDSGVAASFAIVAAERKGIDGTKKIDLTGLFTTYDNTGTKSMANE